MKTLSLYQIWLMLVFIGVSATASNAGVSARSDGNSPVFIQNKGQWPEEVLYLTKLNGLNAWITKSGVTYDHFTIIRKNNPAEFRNLPPHEREQAELENISVKGHVVRMTLLNVNHEAPTAGLDCRQGYHNYFIGNDSSRWASHVPLYGRVEHNKIYDGISVEYYFDQGQLRYDYHLAPGADAGQIRIKPEGTEGWHINPAGELLIETSLGTVCHGKIFAYQLNNGVKAEVECSFKQSADGSLGLHTGNYDRFRPLVIDPIVFSTYLGGNNYEENPAIVQTLDGSIVITGSTQSANFPITPGAYQIVKMAEKDITISKLTSDFSELFFSTFLGGNDMDLNSHIDIDQDQDIFVAGTTFSFNFPVTTGAFQTTNGGITAGFITKLQSDGSALIFSTYLGGIGEDEINAIVVGANGNAYLTGITDSYNFPTTPGTINYDNGHLFVSKINQTGTSLIYSAVFASGSGNSIDIDNNENVYITGEVINYNYFPITPGAFQTQQTSIVSAFAIVINSNATEVLHSTFISGNSEDYGHKIRVTQNGDILVAGFTNSNIFPTSPGSVQPTPAGSYDDFLIKLNANCTQMVWGTLLGGSGWDDVLGMSLDGFENVAVTGYTGSEDFPVTTNLIGNLGYLNPPSFVCLIASDGSSLLFSSFIACFDNYQTTGYDILLNNNNIIVTGTTGSSFPITPNAFQQNFGGGGKDFFIMEILPVNCQTTCTATVLNHVSCNSGSDGQAQANPSGGIEPYSYFWSNGQTTQIATSLSAGNYTVEVTDSIGCFAEASVTITQPTLLELASLQTWPASCANSPDGSALAQASGGTPPYTYHWSNGETGNQAMALLPGSNSLTITDSHQCEKESFFEIDYIHPFNEEEICAVTVNPETGHNQVVWEKTEGVRTIAYKIYRETSASGVYELIGSTPFTEPPMFEDVTANPAQQSYRYKLSVVDSCQEESDLSGFHKTMHLTMNVGINGEVNLLWSPYEGFTYPTHFIMRSVNGGAYQLIGQLPASNFSFTDLTPPTGLKKYMIEIDAPGSCGFSDQFRVRSNAVIVTEIGLNESANAPQFLLKPNPGDGRFVVEIPAVYLHQKLVIEVLNSLGELILTKESFPAESFVGVDISDQPTGIYFVKLTYPMGVTYLKVMKE